MLYDMCVWLANKTCNKFGFEMCWFDHIAAFIYRINCWLYSEE